ncbi:MAG: hypothetical protein K5848_00865 [Lachnospiraceae bacterium]|nr:hypothetical protein [Lachnospiraceae bacterium]
MDNMIYKKLNWCALENTLWKYKSGKCYKLDFDKAVLSSCGADLSPYDKSAVSHWKSETVSRNSKMPDEIIDLYFAAGKDNRELRNVIAENLYTALSGLFDINILPALARELTAIVREDRELPLYVKSELEEACPQVSEETYSPSREKDFYRFLTRILVIAVIRGRIVSTKTVFNSVAAEAGNELNRKTREGVFGTVNDFMCEFSPECQLGAKSRPARLIDIFKAAADNSGADGTVKNGEEAGGLRFFVKGEGYSGKTTAVLDFCKLLLKENERSLVFYADAKTLESYQSFFEYIHLRYLEGFHLSKENDSLESFENFISGECSGESVTIVIDDYDRLPAGYRAEFEAELTGRNRIFESVNILLCLRELNSTTFRNFSLLEATGVSKKAVNRVLKEKLSSINPKNIPELKKIVKSPGLLSLLAAVSSSGRKTVAVTPAGLIIENIKHLVGELPSKMVVDVDCLGFSLWALLPYMAAKTGFARSELYAHLPEYVRNVAGMGVYADSYPVEKFIHDTDPADRLSYFNTFFLPLSEGLGFLRERRQEASSDIAGEGAYKPGVLRLSASPSAGHNRILPGATEYEWCDSRLKNFFVAFYIYMLLDSSHKDEALEEIRNIGETLFPYENGAFYAGGMEEAENRFEQAGYLLELLGNEMPKGDNAVRYAFAELYGAMAVFYDIKGFEDERLDASVKALPLFEEMSEKSADVMTLHKINKLAYYVIKYKPAATEKETAAIKGNDVLYFEKLERTYREKLGEEYGKHLQDAKGYLTRADAKALAIAGGELEHARIHGNLGAFYQKKGNMAADRKESLHFYDLAEAEYRESERLKEELLNAGSYPENLIREALRRSYEQLATNFYKKGEIDKAIEYHYKAIDEGKRIKSGYTYEAYSRLAGCLMAKYDNPGKGKPSLFEYDGTTDGSGKTVGDAAFTKALEILEILKEGIASMNEMGVVNVKELEDIYRKCYVLVSRLKKSFYSVNPGSGGYSEGSAGLLKEIFERSMEIVREHGKYRLYVSREIPELFTN